MVLADRNLMLGDFSSDCRQINSVPSWFSEMCQPWLPPKGRSPGDIVAVRNPKTSEASTISPRDHIRDTRRGKHSGGG